MDPFVGIIVRLPLKRDPTIYGQGLQPQVFDQIVKGIIDNRITGDRLADAVQALSKTCREEEWLFWYKRILQGELDVPIDLATFNQYCPDQFQIPPPALNIPKPIKAAADLPSRFFLQPDYADERVFWLIDSTHNPIEIRCYDSKFRRVRNSPNEEILIEFARSQPMDVVLFGHQTRRGFVTTDILTREQFTAESGVYPFHHRLMALAKLELPTVQMSPFLTPRDSDQFFKEFDLILQQGFDGAIIRDLDARYAFRVQPDLLVKPSIKSLLTCTEVKPGVGLRAESMTAKKMVTANIRLGLTSMVWNDISELSVGRRLEVLSCGQKDGELLLPVFQKWR